MFIYIIRFVIADMRRNAGKNKEPCTTSLFVLTVCGRTMYNRANQARGTHFSSPVYPCTAERIPRQRRKNRDGASNGGHHCDTCRRHDTKQEFRRNHVHNDPSRFRHSPDAKIDHKRRNVLPYSLK